MGGSQLICDMPTLILIMRLTLLEAQHELKQVFSQYTADVPLVHHGHHTVQLDFLLMQVISEIKGCNTEFVEEAPLNGAFLTKQDTNATDVSMGKLDKGIITHPLSLQGGESGLCAKSA